MKTPVAIGLALALGGCANTKAMRILSAQTSARLVTQEAAMNSFIDAGKQLNQDHAASLNGLQAQTAGQQANTVLTLQTWTLAGRKDLLDKSNAATKVQANDILTSLAIAHASAAALDDGGAGASLDKANGAFTAMAKKPGFLDGAKEVFASGGAVYQALQSLEKSAAATTPAAKPPTSATLATTQPSASAAK